MKYKTISLPKVMYDKIKKEQVDTGLFTSVGEYIRYLIRKE